MFGSRLGKGDCWEDKYFPFHSMLGYARRRARNLRPHIGGGVCLDREYMVLSKYVPIQVSLSFHIWSLCCIFLHFWDDNAKNKRFETLLHLLKRFGYQQQFSFEIIINTLTRPFLYDTLIRHYNDKVYRIVNPRTYYSIEEVHHEKRQR